MSEATKEEMREEARLRMLLLLEAGYWDEAVDAFLNEGTVCVSEPSRMSINGNPFVIGTVYTLSEFEEYEPEAVESVRSFEENMHGFPYAVIFNNFEFGRTMSILYVSPHRSEWQMDREDLIDGTPLIYAANIDDSCSEYGFIRIQLSGGGLLRVS